MTEPTLDAQLKQFDAEVAQKRQELVANAVKASRERLGDVDREISRLNKERAQISAGLERLLGRTAPKKSAPTAKQVGQKTKTGHRRKRMTVEMKREAIGAILREEKVSTGFPLAAVTKRLMREAHLSPGDLSPKNIQQFMPTGYRVDGGGRKKTFSVS